MSDSESLKTRSLVLPGALRATLPAARWEEVTVGESGARVLRSSRFMLKIQPKRIHGTLFAEKERLRWLASRIPVPRVVAYHQESGTEYLATERLRGIDMSHPDAALHARRNTELLARALRELHALPVRDCPFDMSLRVMLAEARERVGLGLVDEADFDGERAGHRARDVLREVVRTRPDREDLVLTHGDACLPNVIVAGEFVAGFVDVGRAGIADRHADLALAVRSLRRNYGEEFALLFLDTYGRALVDEDKLQFYQLLDELF
ncbi:APH(3') family aminoglycoside O-phosphotransferase [Deinococcus peraridilitoris]|uniref:Aminoglycoside phosphotransferase n=1 Tax=Deinococcus peraridilitoris (strain DSM 19664 / LMG 22246 / CIP 109416 / KR-200) TaxID=937777 RepID=L0A5A4_DEIPD|nr:APH(3') family aminoglycoside O-phosphotransferase [Deinococcus peraridilitoris]AFZ68185.1 aminoglycoside phosphotransferase [Deinococcus peraridilitoris DSM 19664]